MEIRQKILTLQAPPFNFKVTQGTDTDRSATYNFLLVFRSKYDPV